MPTNKVCETRESPIHGTGLFSLCDIEEGTALFITHMRDPDWSEDMPEDWSGWVNLTPNCMYNHSKAANCISKTEGRRKFLVTKKDIKSGEEILVDYTEDLDLEQPQENWEDL